MKGIFDINWLFNKYYHDNPELKRIVMIHSAQVAKKALRICLDKRLPLDHKKVFYAAMLHDVGVVKCNAPGIHAHGSLPYICHGIEGEKILKENNFGDIASVCARHTGVGLTANEIEEKKLPLPPKDLLPNTLLEKLICYSDKFFSKNKNLKEEKSLEEVIQEMKKYGEDSYSRFMDLHKQFGNATDI